MLGGFHSDNQCMAFIACGDVFLLFMGAVALFFLSSMLCFCDYFFVI